MKRINKAVVALIGLSLAVAPGIFAAEQRADPAKVLSDLHQSNQDEIMAGQMAKEKAQSDAVKQYGQKLIDDHQKADQQVMEVARTQGIDLPATAAATEGQPAIQKHEQMMQALRGKTGADFDHAFVKDMVQDHKKDLFKMSAARDQLQPSPVKDLVTQVVPVLKEHLRIAQQLEKNT